MNSCSVRDWGACSFSLEVPFQLTVFIAFGAAAKAIRDNVLEDRKLADLHQGGKHNAADEAAGSVEDRRLAMESVAPVVQTASRLVTLDDDGFTKQNDKAKAKSRAKSAGSGTDAGKKWQLLRS